MNTRIRHQIIESGGQPLFVLVPYDEYLELVEDDREEETIPLDVSKRINLEGKSPIRAWREHFGLTQAEVAERMGVTRAAYAQMEAADNRPRSQTLQSVAQALDVRVEQLVME